MKPQKMFFVIPFVFLLVSAAIAASGDFDWTRNLNVRAEADPSGFRAQLATRFHIGDAQIDAILSNVERPADAYMVFRLGELAGEPAGRVLEKYRAEKGNGWGALAQSLGIKPGSSEFHALKNGHDMNGDKEKSNSKHYGKGKRKEKGNGKGRH